MREEAGKVQSGIRTETAGREQSDSGKETAGREQAGSGPEAAEAEERELLEILRTCPEDRYRSVIQERKSEFLLEELSGLKANLVRAFKIPAPASVLEIGGGCGSLTEVLAEKSGRLVSWDSDPVRCKINEVRNGERENVTLYAGDFRDFCRKIRLNLPREQKRFDLITCIGPIQRASQFLSGEAPCREMLRELLPFLAEDGFMLILLKGIGEYRQIVGDSLLSGYRTELYEVRPDEKFPMEITGERWLSERHFGGEGSGTGDGTVPALLLIQGNRRTADTLLYAKFSGERAEKYALYTAVYEKFAADGARYVEKTALTKAAAVHVDRICTLSGKLAGMYGDSLQINRCEATEKAGTVRMEYLTGETFEEYLDRILEEQGPEACTKALIRYLDLVVPKDRETAFVMTEPFREIFGEVAGKCETLSLKTLPVSDVDLIPANVIRSGGKSTLIDYEWTFGFPIPSGFLRYRILFYYLRGGEKRQLLEEDGIYEKAGLFGQERRIFASMEDSFQRWLTKDRIPVRDLQEEFSHGCAKTGSRDRDLRVYFPGEDGAETFSEMRASDYRMKDGSFSGELKVPPGTTMIRLDPGDSPGILRIRRLTVDGRPPMLLRTNGMPVFRESEDGIIQTGPLPSGKPAYLSAIYFWEEDPNFTIRWEPEKTSSTADCHIVSFACSFTEVSRDFLTPLADLQKQREASASGIHHRKGGFLRRLTGREN